MQAKGTAECSKGGILQYFRSSLSYHLSFRSNMKFACTFKNLCFGRIAYCVSREGSDVDNFAVRTPAVGTNMGAQAKV